MQTSEFMIFLFCLCFPLICHRPHLFGTLMFFAYASFLVIGRLLIFLLLCVCGFAFIVGHQCFRCRAISLIV